MMTSRISRRKGLATVAGAIAGAALPRAARAQAAACLNADLIRKMTQVPAHADIECNTLPHLTALMTQTGLLTSNVDLRTKVFA